MSSHLHHLASRRQAAKVVRMVMVEFAASLQRHKPCPAQAVPPGSLAQVLDSALRVEPGLRSYVLDDQGHVRKHVAVFVNRTLHLPRDQLQRPIAAEDKVLVTQCLTGG
jgi:sulfur-carrier protein